MSRDFLWIRRWELQLMEAVEEIKITTPVHSQYFPTVKIPNMCTLVALAMALDGSGIPRPELNDMVDDAVRLGKQLNGDSEALFVFRDVSRWTFCLDFLVSAFLCRRSFWCNFRFVILTTSSSDRGRSWRISSFVNNRSGITSPQVGGISAAGCVRLAMEYAVPGTLSETFANRRLTSSKTSLLTVLQNLERLGSSLLPRRPNRS